MAVKSEREKIDRFGKETNTMIMIIVMHDDVDDVGGKKGK